jgi:hypothetical protein
VGRRARPSDGFEIVVAQIANVHVSAETYGVSAPTAGTNIALR